VHWDSKYDGKGVLHKLIDCGSLIALICACTQIEPIEAMTARVEAWWWLLFFYFIIKFFRLIQYGQIAIGHPLKVARLDASSSITNLLVQMGLVGLAWACVHPSVEEGYTPTQLDAYEKAKLSLLLVSPFVVAIRAAWRSIVGGPDFRAMVKEVSIPANVGFIIHRINEFMMLMLGETVLQLVIGDIPTKEPGLEPLVLDDTQRKYVCNIICGAVIALCMLHSHTNTAPTDPKKHAMRRGLLATAIFYVGLSCKTCVTLLVGIGVKIALYDPASDGTSASASLHRIQLGWALFMTFGHQLVLKPLHQGVVSYFGPILRNPFSLVALILRCVGYLAMYLVYLAEVPVWQYMLIEAGIAAFTTACLQIENWTAAMTPSGTAPATAGHSKRVEV